MFAETNSISLPGPNGPAWHFTNWINSSPLMLHEWWLDRGDHDFTSVTFLIDRNGTVRFIHPGGQYVKGDKDYKAIKAKIDELLADK